MSILHEDSLNGFKIQVQSSVISVCLWAHGRGRGTLRSCQEIGAVLIDSPDQHDGEGDGFVRRWDFWRKVSHGHSIGVEVSASIPLDRRYKMNQNDTVWHSSDYSKQNCSATQQWIIREICKMMIFPWIFSSMKSSISDPKR